MIKYILRWGLIAFLVLFSSLLYVEIQGYLAADATFTTIKVFSAKSKSALALIFTSFNFLGAILTAIFTALPCGYLAGKHVKIITILFIVSMQSIPAYVVFQEPKIESFIAVVWFGQLITGVISVVAFTEIGRRIAVKRLSQPVSIE